MLFRLVPGWSGSPLWLATAVLAIAIALLTALILGTFGLATVQLQYVLECRGELALLRATGFRRWRLVELVMLENVFLLLGGLGIGVLASLVAILPHWLLGGASIPWGSLLVILTGVVVTGMGVGLLTARSVLKAPLVDALRGS